MSRELPEGWVEASLGSVITLHNGDRGKNYPSGNAILDSGVPFINAGHIQNGQLDFGKMNYISEKRFDLLGGGKVQQGDLLYCLRGSLGKTALVPPGIRGAIASSLVILRPSNAVLPDLAYSFLISPLGNAEIEKFDNGSAQPNLSAKSVAEYNFPLPPLNEQKRIVAKVDALTEKSREARQALDEVPALLDKLRQSILAAAFRGDLTKKWREQNPDVEPASVLLERIRKERRHRWEEAELAKFKSKGKVPKGDEWKSKYKEPEPVDTEGLPELPEGWCWAPFPSLGELARGKSKHRPRNDSRLFGSAMPFIQTGDVARAEGIIESYSSKYSDFGIAQSRVFPAGTLCITIAANIADTALLGFDACFPDSVVGFIPLEPLDARFFEYFVRTAQQDLEQFAPATAQKNINLEILGQVVVPVPPLLEMQEMVARLDEAMGGAKMCALEERTLGTSLSELDASILAKAFRGELVPQDPNDEPASVLLERIRKEREGRGSRKTRMRDS